MMADDLPTHGRYVYTPITARANYDWPGGRRLAVYVGLNLEHFAFGNGLGAALVPAQSQPDVLNYAWRDYGNRVGVWRLLELFDNLSLPLGVLVNTAIYDYCPEVMDAFRARGDEIIAHGHTNSEHQGEMSEDVERRLLDGCARRIAREEGMEPAGWLSPWISESALTPDLLRERGYRYTLNWCHDDQPTRFSTRSGQLWSIPYPQEINDIPAVVARLASGALFADMIVDTYDEMIEQSVAEPLVMGIALHPYIVGQPHRLRHLRRALGHIVADGRAWLTRPVDIVDYLDVSQPF
ncbi:polysaccharide deacetylase family protein [Acidihalobacter ferrooxydans]|nr:polysaccharide deacetylase family protein [Acidihalobacter ferrooxydans]